MDREAAIKELLQIRALCDSALSHLDASPPAALEQGEPVIFDPGPPKPIGKTNLLLYAGLLGVAVLAWTEERKR